MIKNIIFDLGGVIVNVDNRLFVDAFKKLGVQNYEEALMQAMQHQLPELYEMGKITTADLRARAKKIMGIEHVADAEFDRAWNTGILNLPKERLEFVRKFKQKYNTYLLSNINEMHFEQNFVICYRDTGLKNFADIFHKEYYSHLVGMRKPDPEIFKLVLNENNLIPHETLFVDDTLENILSARNLGIKTHHINSQQDIFTVTALLH